MYKKNTHLRLKTYTFSFGLHVLFIFCPVLRAGTNEFNDKNILHSRDLYAERYAKLPCISLSLKAYDI